MADLRIPPAQVPAVARPQPAARLDTIRQAQRAFFQTASLDQPAAPPAPSQPASSQPASGTSADQPVQRLPRPGSIVDIKV